MIALVLAFFLACLATGGPIGIAWDSEALRPIFSFWEFSPYWRLSAVAGDIVQIYAIFGGLVAQVISLVPMVFQPGVVQPAKIIEINRSLLKLQRQLLGLVLIYILTLLFVVSVKLTAPDPTNHVNEGGVSIFFLWGSVFLVVFSIVRTIEMAISIVSIQILRSSLILEEAQQKLEQAAIQKPRAVAPDPNPSAYGQKVQTLK